MTAFQMPVRVYIEDTDAGGIVYYVNYLKYFERARTEYFRQLGYDKPAFLEGGKLLVVSELQTKYHRPAKLDDLLSVSATIVECKRVSLLFQQEVLRGSELLASATIRIACVEQEKMKPAAIPAEILRTIQLNNFYKTK